MYRPPAVQIVQVVRTRIETSHSGANYITRLKNLFGGSTRVGQVARGVTRGGNLELSLNLNTPSQEWCGRFLKSRAPRVLIRGALDEYPWPTA